MTALTEAQRGAVSLHFLLLDQDSDGRLAITELGPLLRAAGLYPTSTEVQSLESVVDPDQTGTFTLPQAMEVIETLYPQRSTTEELREALKALDEDADGYLTAAELRHILVHLGLRLTHEEADEVIGDVEKDGEKNINIDDLVTLLMTEAPLGSA